MQLPIRVLQVVVNMNRGGAETLIMNIYRNIDRDKVQFDFLVHKNQGAYEKEIAGLGGNIYRIPYITDVGHFGYVRELNKFFREHSNYKIVHSHMDSMSGLVLESAKNAGIQVRISHSHNTRNEGNVLSRIYKQFIRGKIISNATNLVACSDAAARWLFGSKAPNALVFKNGIEPQMFGYSDAVREKKRGQLGIDSHTLLIGHVGRFYAQKNHSFLLEIFSEVKDKCKDSVLLLIGDGPLRSEMEKKTKKLKLEDSVLFLGLRDDVPELLQAMDVLVFPSHHEGVPLTIIEAQAAGLKCVVSKALTYSVDIGNDLVTFLSLKTNIDEWAREICSPYKRKFDTCNYLGSSGYDITCTAKEIEDYYLNGCENTS